MQKSILKKLRLYMISFGVLMGFVFPVYAQFFVVFKEGMIIYFIVGCLLAGITVGIVSFTFVKVILLKPLLKMSKVANELKNRKITSRIELKSNDSVGDIINGINASGENMGGFLKEIENATQINNQILENVNSDNGANTNSINNINSSIKTVTEAAKSISDHSQQICFSMAESNDSISEWQLRLQDMLNLTDKLSSSMNSLIHNTANIDAILSGIEDIARRTNLVSINATIEAAGAGAHGKGFSVVATEIRELANSVSKSATDITGYIQAIGTDLHVSDTSLKEIVRLTDENKSSSLTLKTNLNTINDVATSNYRADKQLVNAVEKLNSSFKAIEEVIQSLSDSTRNMQKMVTSYEK